MLVGIPYLPSVSSPNRFVRLMMSLAFIHGNGSAAVMLEEEILNWGAGMDESHFPPCVPT